MNGASSRARLGDLKAMHLDGSQATLVTSATAAGHHSCSRATLPGGSCSCAGPRPTGLASSASLSSLAYAQPGGAPPPPTRGASYKSVGVACEVRLAEAIGKSRIADRLLRSSGAARTAAEGAVDRSISALATVVFDTLHAAQSRPLGTSLHAQLVAVLEQLVWSEQTRLVSLDETPQRTLTKSSSSLALNKAPSAAVVAPPALERLTHYELNLLHARNDASWRTHVGTLSDREATLAEQLAQSERENAELKADVLTFAREAQQAKDRHRELERVIQSLDGRLNIAQMAYEEQATRLAALQNFAGEQTELVLQARQEVVAARTEAAGNKTWSLDESNDAMREKVVHAEKAVLAAEEQTASVNVLYYALMQSCHKAIMKKDQLATELDAAKKEIEALSLTRAEILRPYTPRPEWRAVLRAHPCELTPTFLSTSAEPTSTQIHTILTYFTQKDEEIASHARALDETMAVQNATKKQLLKAKRDLEIAVRTGMAGTTRAGQGAGGGEETQRPRMGMSSLYVKPKSTSRYFVSLGTGKEVPPYLRAQGKIRNRHLSKKDCEMVVRDVWQRKMAHDKERGRLDLNLSDYFHFYLKHKYGLQSLLSEWGYSMLDALERYRWDADCELFLKILCGELAEEAFYDQQHMMSTLTQLFMTLEVVRSERKASALVPGAVVHQLPMEYITRALRLLFPAKAEDAFEAVCSALAQEFESGPKSREDYGLLFRENRTLNETGFIEEIRDQHLYELENFMITFTEQVVLLPREEGEDEQDATTGEPSEGRVRIYDIHNAWIRLDPQATVESMNRYIARALRLPPGVAVDPTTLVPPNSFCQDLFSMSLVKFTNNFDPTACAKLAALPLPELLPTTLPANAATNGAAPSAADGDKKPKNGRRNTYEADLAKIPSPTGSAAAADAQQPLPAAKAKKETTTVGAGGTLASFTSPKLLRLRVRFGLDLRPEDTPTGAVLERGANYQDPGSCMRTNEKEVETLLTEKSALDEARTNERTRVREQAERSAQAIQGIGVYKRRDDKPAPEEKMSASSSRTSLVSSTSAHFLAAAATVTATVATATSDGVASIQPESVVSFELNGLDLPLQHVPSPPPPLSSPVAASPRVGRKVAVRSGAVAADQLRYKSSFFTAPEVHAATASHEEPTTGGAGALGSMMTPAALRKQRRRSADPLEPSREPSRAPTPDKPAAATMAAEENVAAPVYLDAASLQI